MKKITSNEAKSLASLRATNKSFRVIARSDSDEAIQKNIDWIASSALPPRNDAKLKRIIPSLIIILLLTTMLSSVCAAENENGWIAVDYYQQGQKYFESSDYTKAIEEFRKALRVVPDAIPERASLINSYLARADYYTNKTKQNDLALNDLRSALFYLKYYTDAPMDAQMTDAAKACDNNISILMGILNESKDPKSRLNKAKQLRATGNFPAAATEFQYALADPSTRFESYKALGDIANIFSMPKMAVTYYGNALKANDSDADTHLKLARALETVGNVNAAATQYNLALSTSNNSSEILNSLEKIWQEKADLNPNDAEAQANLGAVYQKKNNLAQAMAQYQKALILNPSNTNTRLNIGTLYQLQKRFPEAISSYDKVLAASPQNAAAYYYKAQSMRDLGQKQDAIEAYKMALSINPKIGNAKTELFDLAKDSMSKEELLGLMQQDVKDNPNNPEAYYQFAYELHKANKLDDAINFYKDAIKLNPKYTDAYINLAQAYKQQLKYPEALVTLEVAKKELPDDTNIDKYYTATKGEIKNIAYDDATKLFNDGNYDKAIEKFMSIQPETSESLIGIAAAYQKTEDYKSAMEYYKKALVLDPKNSDIAYYIAMLALQEGMLDDAKTYAQKSLALDAKNAKAKEIMDSANDEDLNNQLSKALELYDSQKYDDALKSLNDLIAKDVKNSNAYYYRGMTYDAQKKYDLAIKDYNTAYSLNKDLIVTRYSVAVAYDYQAKYKDAAAAFKQFLDLSPAENEFTEYAKKRLQELNP